MRCSRTPPTLLVFAVFTAIGLPALSEAANPVITDVFTADPAAFVYDNTVYLYIGHDEAPDRRNGYVMKDWLCFSSTGMVNWTPHGAPLKVSDFNWATGNAWAGQVIERDGKFYWYVAVHAAGGFGVGVAISDNPTGPFHDAIGAALITNDMTREVKISYDDINPTVFIDDDGQAYLFWGNTKCYYAKPKRNMTQFDGPIHTITPDLPRYTEAPWLHKHNGLYYLSYAYDFPEKIAYATAEKSRGRGPSAASSTNSPATATRTTRPSSTTRAARTSSITTAARPRAAASGGLFVSTTFITILTARSSTSSRLPKE